MKDETTVIFINFKEGYEPSKKTRENFLDKLSDYLYNKDSEVGTGVRMRFHQTFSTPMRDKSKGYTIRCKKNIEVTLVEFVCGITITMDKIDDGFRCELLTEVESLFTEKELDLSECEIVLSQHGCIYCVTFERVPC